MPCAQQALKEIETIKTKIKHPPGSEKDKKTCHVCNGEDLLSYVLKKGCLVEIKFINPNRDNKLKIPSIGQLDSVESDGIMIGGIPFKFSCLQSIKFICPSCGPVEKNILTENC